MRASEINKDSFSIVTVLLVFESGTIGETSYCRRRSKIVAYTEARAIHLGSLSNRRPALLPFGRWSTAISATGLSHIGIDHRGLLVIPGLAVGGQTCARGPTERGARRGVTITLPRRGPAGRDPALWARRRPARTCRRARATELSARRAVRSVHGHERSAAQVSRAVTGTLEEHDCGKVCSQRMTSLFSPYEGRPAQFSRRGARRVPGGADAHCPIRTDRLPTFDL